MFLFKNELYKHFENLKKDRRANSLLCLNYSFKKPKIYSLHFFIEVLNFQNFIKVKKKLEKIIKSLFNSVFEIDIK